ncbi:MAG: hypothetical protein K0R58_2378 [Ramlibacter sp.]|jgi:hypothetical protein|nr:hypothetical protein [Ramlibacter sp.]
MTIPECSMLLGADFGRSDGQTAEVFYYTRAASGIQVQVHAPAGWKLAEHQPLHAMVQDRRIGKATLVGTGGPIEVGSPVRLRAVSDAGESPAATEELKIRITSDALTAWSLMGPVAVDAADALAAGQQLDARYADDEASSAPWRMHAGLQCSAYVNLTAFLENIYGPIPSGDYKVYKRIAYASSFVYSPDECAADLHLVGEDRFVVLWNGVEAVRSERANHPVLGRVTLQRGWNRVWVKSSQDGTREWGGRRWGFELRLIGSHGERLEGIFTSSHAPPAQSAAMTEAP